MKIGLQTWGSDGDIRPFLSLAGALSAAAHEVSLVVTSVDQKDYTQYGKTMNFSINHVGTLDYPPDFLSEFATKLRAARVPVNQLNLILKHFFDPVIADMYTAAKNLCETNDIMIGHFVHHPAMAAAEKTGTPYLTVTLNHSTIVSNQTVPHGLINVGNWLNPFWWKLCFMIIDRVLKPEIKKLRIQEHLPPVSNVLQNVWNSGKLNLIAVSPLICERKPDWKASNKVCGFFNMNKSDEKWTMPPALQTFLDDGPPPIYVTVGSMISLDTRPDIITKILVDGVRMAGCRALVQSRWDELPYFPDYPDIYKISTTPHQHIFQKCSVVVHHGGAGTTQSATLNGCPSIIIEHFGDQIFWASELRRLGIAPRVLHRRNLTASKLAKKIRQVLDAPGMKTKAEKMAETMRKENGVEKAVGLIEENFQKQEDFMRRTK